MPTLIAAAAAGQASAAGAQRYVRRLGVVASQLAASASEVELPQPGSGPGDQGFGPRETTQPPAFSTDQLTEALAFFQAEGRVPPVGPREAGQFTGQ